MMRAAELLSEVPGLRRPARSFLGTHPESRIILDERGGAFVGREEEVAPLLTKLEQLHSAAWLLLSVVDEALGEEDPSTINVRLPNVNSLEELERVVDDLKTCIDRPARLVVGHGVSLHAFDVGSSWLVLVGAVALVPAFVASLLRACRRYMDESLQHEMMLERLRTLKAIADHSENVKRTTDQALQLLSHQLADEVIAEYGSALSETSRNEAHPSVMNAITTLSALLRRNAEVAFALNAPKETTEKAPLDDIRRLVKDFDDLKLLPGPSADDEQVPPE